MNRACLVRSIHALIVCTLATAAAAGPDTHAPAQPFATPDARPVTPVISLLAPDARQTGIGLRGRFGSLGIEPLWQPRHDARHLAADPLLRHRMSLYPNGPAGTAVDWSRPMSPQWSVGAAYVDLPTDPWHTGQRPDARLVGTVGYRNGGLSLLGASSGAGDWNLLGRYTEGRNTWRLMLGRGRGSGEASLNFGLDHRYSRALTLFAEFHHDDAEDAIPFRYDRLGIQPGPRNGRGILTGLRYDF